MATHEVESGSVILDEFFDDAGAEANGKSEQTFVDRISPKLRCEEDELAGLAQRYRYPLDDSKLVNLKPSIVERGWMTKDELRTVASWKSPRSAGRMETNSKEYVEEITSFAFQAKNERARIEVMTCLDGVGWPMASVILHFFHREPYPIIDYRALWSVSLKVPPQYSFEFWWMYAKFCRQLSRRSGLDMRTLDRALWQYSNEKQKAIGRTQHTG